MNSDHIGKTISVITKQLSRYQGILIDIDTAKKTMTLKSVQSFGTEGRRGDNEIPGNSNVIAQVKFKVELIQDFNIVEEESELDPAIIESSGIEDQTESKKP